MMTVQGCLWVESDCSSLQHLLQGCLQFVIGSQHIAQHTPTPIKVLLYSDLRPTLGGALVEVAEIIELITVGDQSGSVALLRRLLYL